ncbi:B-cell linker protein-like isoform X2 [Liolophura sinensis]|uniref:B-cell linker protein-like isoform X2 n=1 Tax=Liolophura sinensis TaxID=3198878 RepID=UPI003158EAF2
MCAAANYSGPNVTDGFATLRRFRRRISSILTIPEYLSEIQLFQMKNVSVKTKSGLKNAQKNVKGRPTVNKKTVIMATDRPPQTPSKDYRHFTPDVDDHDDGWGSDFSDTSDVASEAEEEEDDFDDEYEEPTQHHLSMPQSSTAPMNTYRRVSPVAVRAPKHHTRKSLPPEPPAQETYEDPHQEYSDEPEDYEEPIDFPSSRKPLPYTPTHHHTPTHRHPHAPPGKQSPPRPPSKLPPRVPRRPKLEETYEIEDDMHEWDEDYEKPEKGLVPPGANRSEIISTSGKLKPSNIAQRNYPRVEIPQVVGSLVDQAGNDVLLRPSQLKERQTKAPSHHPRSESTSEKPPEIPVSNKMFSKPVTKPHINRSTGLPGRSLPKPPEDQEMEGLYSYTWYHGDLTRDAATEKLTARAQNGMFLVRKSTKTGSPYALSLFYGTRVYNLNIRLRADNKYALGTPKQDEKSFTGVPPLISYFQSNMLVLGGDTSTQTNLLNALPK